MNSNPWIKMLFLSLFFILVSCRKDEKIKDTEKEPQKTDLPRAEPEVMTPALEDSEDDNKPSDAPEDAAPNMEEPIEG